MYATERWMDMDRYLESVMMMIVHIYIHIHKY